MKSKPSSIFNAAVRPKTADGRPTAPPEAAIDSTPLRRLPGHAPQTSSMEIDVSEDSAEETEFKSGEHLRLRLRKRAKEVIRKGFPQREELKVPFPRNRGHALYRLLFIHAVPLGVAIFLIVLNARTRFLGPSGKWIGALQFAAKAHEILMQFSIITAMVAYLQHLLTRERPVPFGAIFLGYRVTELSYLWSPEFRAALTARGFKGNVKVVFALFVTCSILLAAGVGPSSAIAMQARPIIFNLSSVKYGLDIQLQDLFPPEFDTAGYPLKFNDGTLYELSPAAGWQYLKSLPTVRHEQSQGIEHYYEYISATPPGINENAQAGLVGRDQQASVYSFPVATSGLGLVGAVVSPRTMYSQYAANSSFATIQSVPLTFAMESAFNAMEFELGPSYSAIGKAPVVESIVMAQPYVTAYCHANPIKNGNDTSPLLFPKTYLAQPTEEEDIHQAASLDPGTFEYHLLSKKEIWAQWKNSTRGFVIWLDNQTVSTPVQGPALGAIVVQPELCETNSTYLATSACLVGARWINTTSLKQRTYDTVEQRWVIHAMYNQFDNSTIPNRPEWTSEPGVRFYQAWLNSLDPRTEMQNRTVVDNLLRFMSVTDDVCPNSETHKIGNIEEMDYGKHYGTFQLAWSNRTFMHEGFLTTLLANGMSHSVNRSYSGFVRGADPDDPSKKWMRFAQLGFDGWDEDYISKPDTVVSIDRHLVGYGWNLEGVPIKIALSVMVIYCLYITVHISYTLLTGHSASTWRSVSEMVALAFNSTPSKVLANTGCGIGATDTYRQLVSVREVERNARVELVFEKDQEEVGPEGYERLRRERAYA